MSKFNLALDEDQIRIAYGLFLVEEAKLREEGPKNFFILATLRSTIEEIEAVVGIKEKK